MFYFGFIGRDKNKLKTNKKQGELLQRILKDILCSDLDLRLETLACFAYKETELDFIYSFSYSVTTMQTLYPGEAKYRTKTLLNLYIHPYSSYSAACKILPSAYLSDLLCGNFFPPLFCFTPIFVSFCFSKTAKAILLLLLSILFCIYV